jgi:hypothetical protein
MTTSWTLAMGRDDFARTALVFADLAAAFDRIDHAHLLAQLGSFPARGTIAPWLRAGMIDQGRFAPTEEDSPQGGVISPLLMNVSCTEWSTPRGSATSAPAATPVRRGRAPRC